MGQCVDAAREDITVLTALMECRPLAGDPAAPKTLAAALALLGVLIIALRRNQVMPLLMSIRNRVQ